MLPLWRGNAAEPGAFLVRTMLGGIQARSRHDCKGGPSPPANSDLCVFENSRIPGEYKIGTSTEVRQRARGLQRSQSFYIHSVASFEGKGHLEQKVRHMLAHCLLPREVAPGREWHACSLQTALGAIGQAIDSEKALQ